jgi:hypothetical protein
VSSGVVSGLGAARSDTTRAAQSTMIAPTTHMPARLLPVRSARAPVAYGAAKPPRLPSELIRAIRRPRRRR